MLGIGEELKRVREEKGLSIYDVETETKIKATFIEAIENEKFDKIPGRVYVRGFIKNYAKFLGLDYTDFLKKLNQHFKETEDEDILANSKPQLIRPIKDNQLSGNIMKLALAMLIIGVLAFGGYKGIEYFTSSNGENPQVVEEKPQVPVEKPEQKPEAPPEETPQAVEPTPEEPISPPLEEAIKDNSSEKIVLEVIMSEGGPGVDSCWIQVIADGKLEFEQTILAGREPMKFTAKKTIDFTYGNAAAIKIKIDGKDQGSLGEPGEVGTKRYKIDDL